MIPYGPQQLHGCSHLQTQTLFYRGTSCIHEDKAKRLACVFSLGAEYTDSPWRVGGTLKIFVELMNKQIMAVPIQTEYVF